MRRMRTAGLVPRLSIGVLIVLAPIVFGVVGAGSLAARSGLNRSGRGPLQRIGASASGPGAMADLSFEIDGVVRHALVHQESTRGSTGRSPLVFVFHGHGGNAQNAARRFHIHTLWPEAVVAYMQGIPGVVGITDAEGIRNGWQKNPGELGDRDIKFFDVALERLQKEYKTDPDRVYLIGHSNGARFVNVLWSVRGNRLAALCSASGQGGRLIESAPPKPIFIIAGKRDRLVPFEGQMMSVALVRQLLKTDSSKATEKGFATMEPGRDGTELVTYLHPGGHEFPEDALPLVVSFFQRHARNRVASK